MDWLSSFDPLVKPNAESMIHHVFLGQACSDAELFDLCTEGFEEFGGIFVSGGCHVPATYVP